MKTLVEEITSYRTMLKLFNVDDEQVMLFEQNIYSQIVYMFYSFFMLLISLIFVLPGNLMIFPLSSAIAFKGEQERLRALKKSVVKVKATDVLASFKLTTYIVSFPIYLIIFTYIYNLTIRMKFEVEWNDSIKQTIIFFFLFPLL